LNIEAGENAFVGAFNNPATVLLSDRRPER